jgi:hypothetical protein
MQTTPVSLDPGVVGWNALGGADHSLVLEITRLGPHGHGNPYLLRWNRRGCMMIII